jgi:hypothetical protein
VSRRAIGTSVSNKFLFESRMSGVLYGLAKGHGCIISDGAPAFKIFISA